MAVGSLIATEWANHPVVVASLVDRLFELWRLADLEDSVAILVSLAAAVAAVAAYGVVAESETSVCPV